MIDYAIALWLNHLGLGTFIDSITAFISNYIFLFIFWLVILIFIFIKDKKKGKNVIIAIAIALILYLAISEGVAKGIVGSEIYFRERPYSAHPAEIIPIGMINTNTSFPSNHMASTLAILSVILLFYRKKWIWILSILFILLMAFARMHNGMHYLTDIAAGALLGIIFGLSGVWIAKNIIKKYKFLS